jgi:hypothetical protein
MSLKSHLLPHRTTNRPDQQPPGSARSASGSTVPAQSDEPGRTSGPDSAGADRSTSARSASAGPATAQPALAEPAASDRTAEQHALGARVFVVQRAGAVLVAAFLLVFGVLGFSGGLDFFSTEGESVLGLSSNGLLSTISVVVAAVLIGAALRGPRIASTVMIVIGSLFLLSALVNLAALRTSFNFLAFEMSNVIFSVVVGLLLLTLGAYGRVSGHLPADSPYAHRQAAEAEPDAFPSTPEEFAAEDAMREAERAVSNHTATDDQARRVRAMAQVHTREERRRVWMSFDRPQPR